MSASGYRGKGFTIVELLIVIVVIGILAAMTIVAFNGIQRRAQNTARIQTAKNFRTALEIIDNERGSYSNLLVEQDGRFANACYAKGLPDINGDGAGDCHVWNGSVIASESAAFTAALNDLSPIPSGKIYPEVRSRDGNTWYLSPFVYTAGVDGGMQDVIEYQLVGAEQDCVLRPVVIFGGSPDYTMNNPSNLPYSFQVRRWARHYLYHRDWAIIHRPLISRSMYRRGVSCRTVTHLL